MSSSSAARLFLDGSVSSFDGALRRNENFNHFAWELCRGKIRLSRMLAQSLLVMIMPVTLLMVFPWPVLLHIHRRLGMPGFRAFLGFVSLFTVSRRTFDSALPRSVGTCGGPMAATHDTRLPSNGCNPARHQYTEQELRYHGSLTVPVGYSFLIPPPPSSGMVLSPW